MWLVLFVVVGVGGVWGRDFLRVFLDAAEDLGAPRRWVVLRCLVAFAWWKIDGSEEFAARYMPVCSSYRLRCM